MTRFNTLFNRMFQEKSRTVYLIFLIQVFASFCFTIFAAFSLHGDFNVVNDTAKEAINPIIGSLAIFASIVLVTSFPANFIYWIVSSIRNEKINRSQTWRLIPISDTKFLLSNFGTAFLSYIWLEILEFVIVAITALPLFLSSGEIKTALGHANWKIDAQSCWQMLGALVLIILLGYAWYAIVSLLNLSSRSIIDFLPNGSNKFLIFVVRVITIVVVIWLLGYAGNALIGATNQILSLNISENMGMGPVLIQFLVFDAVLTLIDIFLLNKFVEAKQN